MGRELRRVPENWKHPKYKKGTYRPMHGEYYGDAVKNWYEQHTQWLEGTHRLQLDSTYTDSAKYKFLELYDITPPPIYFYNWEKWTPETAPCFQMYETITEGSPVSPILILEELLPWLLENGWSEGNYQTVINNPNTMIYKQF